MKTYNLYLVKKEIAEFDKVMTQSALEKISLSSGLDMDKKNAFFVDGISLGDESRMYIFKGELRPPSWLQDVSSVFSVPVSVNNKSSCCVVVFRCNSRLFVTTFAHGWHYIDESILEPDFGLIVAINSLDDGKIKRVDRSHLGEAIKGVSQSAFQRDLQSFGLDEALDLVRRVTGQAEDAKSANLVSGATALKISRYMNFSDIVETAKWSIQKFSSENYKNTSFRIVDKVRPVFNREIVRNLDGKALDIIKDGGNNFELSMPGWSEEDVVHYGFSGLRDQHRYPDLLMHNYRAALGEKISQLNLESIVDSHGVYAEFANNSLPRKNFSIKKALIGSVVDGDALYAISEGEWYRLDEGYKKAIDEGFRDLKRDIFYNHDVLVKKISDDGKKIGFESEIEYNRKYAKINNLICLDQEILQVNSVNHGKFEACDLLDISGRKLIHVKRSSRQSSVLSHLFKQGANSAKILKMFPEARIKLIEKVQQISDESVANDLKNNMDDTLSGWAVEFHIIDHPRPNGEYNIPFFSRISLNEEARFLKGMAFRVMIGFIPAEFSKA
ncbi:DUF6119 family protein [Niveispirillum sp. KHB5.9]|uniref:DUF6119 family protein n=1 Tax=Niveispirillum sp. KHB5.9 TaxID=3400269 RepID=UPI003A8B8FC6